MTIDWPVATIDFEASALDEDSYPIEVGIAVMLQPGSCVTGWSALIRPDWRWLEQGRWSPKSAAIHGLSLDILQHQGQAPTEVAAALDHRLSGLTVYCDDLAYDQYWLARLYAAAGREPRFTLASPRSAQVERLPASGHRAHRALPDAERLLSAIIQRNN
ncbi:MAG: hypothetical protein K2X57_28785 [Xanthobacteraceae bacterium]|nr:hypothetical protein [Xanthobacteraceae bacterium]